MLPQRDDCQEGDDADSNDARFECAKAHIADSDAFIVFLHHGKQRNGSPDNGEMAVLVPSRLATNAIVVLVTLPVT